MKNNKTTAISPKREYQKPLIELVAMDYEISLVMASDPPEPGGSAPPDHFSLNPFKMLKF